MSTKNRRDNTPLTLFRAADRKGKGKEAYTPEPAGEPNNVRRSSRRRRKDDQAGDDSPVSDLKPYDLEPRGVNHGDR